LNPNIGAKVYLFISVIYFDKVFYLKPFTTDTFNYGDETDNPEGASDHGSLN